MLLHVRFLHDAVHLSSWRLKTAVVPSKLLSRLVRSKRDVRAILRVYACICQVEIVIRTFHLCGTTCHVSLVTAVRPVTIIPKMGA
jgi:hypothetical protein